MAGPTPTLVFIPFWESGHFITTVEAGKRMIGTGGAASLTVLVMRAPTEFKASEVEGHVRREAAACGHDIRFRHLPAVEHPTGCDTVAEFRTRYVQLHAQHVKAAIAGLTSPVAAVVVDFFFTSLLDVARELAVPGYVHFASPASFLALMLRLPELRGQLTAGVGFEEMEGTVDVPGLPPVPPSYMPVCLTRSNFKSYDWFEQNGREFMEAKGIIVNTTVELEGGVLAAVAEHGRCVPGRTVPATHAIGPVICSSTPPPPEQSHECLRWLDAQPPASVLFLCFGSMGHLDAAQVREVAAGLGRSGHRFLWVLRGAPAGGARYPTDANVDELLPVGFLELTRGKGMVWPRWAPQRDVLAHAAVGGFVTHCGWNSVLESLWSGVPMVPWPLYGEQQLNAFELVACVGAAVELRMRRDTGGGPFVEAAEVERAVRCLMGGEEEEGRKARERAAEMGAACRMAVEEGGSSDAALQRLLREMLGTPTEAQSILICKHDTFL